MKKIMDKELNMVNGGTIAETAYDSWALYDKKYIDEDYSIAGVIFHWLTYSAKVDEGWAKAGITSVTKPFSFNQYFKDGKEINQAMAWHMIGE